MRTSSINIEGWRERLKVAMSETGRSNADIAASVGLSRGYFTNIFKDGKEPTIVNLAKICQEIGVSMSKIMYGYEVSPEIEEILTLIEEHPQLRAGILSILRSQSKT